MTRLPSAHGALFALAAKWGVGGLLTDLEEIAAGAGPLPREADDLVRALAAFAGQYAPWGSTHARHAWRTDPCPLCSAVVATEEAMTRA